MYYKYSAGFTRKELVVVLGMVTVISVTLYPVFTHATKHDYKMACLTNLKQIGRANSLYMQDWDETLPFAWGASGPWYETLTPYVPDRQGAISQSTAELSRANAVWHCPTDTLIGDGQHFLSYATNGLIVGGGFDPSVYSWNVYGYYVAHTLASIDFPQQVVFAGDMVPGYGTNGIPINYTPDWVRPSQDLDTHPADDSDPAVKYYHDWLKIDMTDLQPGYQQYGPGACPHSIAINWTSPVSCKMISWRHSRTGVNTGYANFDFVDGHVKQIAFSAIRPHNFFPHLTTSQIAAYDN